MNIERFRQLVESYGTVPERWPADERDEALRLLGRSEDAQRIVNEESGLDDALARSAMDIDLSTLESRIMDEVDRQSGWVERLVGWLMPDLQHPATLWRPALAAGLPLVFGVFLGTSITFQGDPLTDTEDDMLILMGLTSIEVIETESLP